MSSYKFIPELISASDLQRKSGEVLDYVSESTKPYFVVRNNKPVVVIISVEEYERLKLISTKYEKEYVKNLVQEVNEYMKTSSEPSSKIVELERFNENLKLVPVHIQKDVASKIKILYECHLSKSPEVTRLAGDLLGFYSFHINDVYNIIYRQFNTSLIVVDIGVHEIYK